MHRFTCRPTYRRNGLTPSLFIPSRWSLFSARFFSNATSSPPISSANIRHKFIDYFREHGHEPVKSASLIPHDDPSLLFTNAGMVQFKKYFLHPEKAPFRRAVTIQKCMRAGGKHNDLDNVGFTPRHHTFFEMLGNFSFGDYSKTQAIRFAWNFLTEKLGLPEERLRVTVLHEDLPSYQIWRNEIGLPDSRILRCGHADNFWTMSDGEGPCGPCTEIFWDTQDETLAERWVEIWNLVFMQNYRNEKGSLEDLPTLCIDTGMGLERLASALQGKVDNFETDEFRKLIEGLRDVMAKRSLESPSSLATPAEKIIVDHFRASCFLIGDGVIPSNIGRGYVLRRILRRALRSGWQLGFKEPFMTEIYGHLISTIDRQLYPELFTRSESIKGIICQEEEIFLKTLQRGLELLDASFMRPELAHEKRVPPEIAFQLYDTYGFPVDLTVVIANERGWSVDVAEVHALQMEQKKRGRASWKSADGQGFSEFVDWQAKGVSPIFTGYDPTLLSSQSKILASSLSLDPGGKSYVAIDPCPFYGLGGGQLPDRGSLTLSNGSTWNVDSVLQPYEGGLVLQVSGPSDQSQREVDARLLREGNAVEARVDPVRREGMEIHHTATHLLNAALRKTLRVDVVQAGSLVDTERLRFDFTYGRGVTPEQVKAIEAWINEVSLSGARTQIKTIPYKQAIEEGAIATFSEKYGEIVRMVEIPSVSKELCGGTHLDSIEKIYPFKILSEGSVAAGTRRIEAVAGRACVRWYMSQHEYLQGVMAKLGQTLPHRLEDSIAALQAQSKLLSKRNQELLDRLARSPILPSHHAHQGRVDGQDLEVWLEESDDAEYLVKRMGFLVETRPSQVHVLCGGQRVIIGVGANAGGSNANKILKQIMQRVGGKGGGRAELAQGRIPEALDGPTLLKACGVGSSA
ncbi:uncharacterized protein VTP21DRAFT_10617 [Calcarisporiella thermophila]|uniref:uncharacterized protein n=1 Tax=Calcarisporiella thermophila TaxID=911321 RepID=UPI00374409D0